MLTHQEQRPEKCPIPSCEFHVKGFARKYDKNRHTLTHYKGTMVCDFCPGSGSAAEKSFNRADVFKRHLTSVHGVEQTPPNARRKSPSGGVKRGYVSRETSGTCSTCRVVFANAQEFYEHLDGCVLRVVQQADPSEAINEKLLTSVSQDKSVKETMERHSLSSEIDYTAPTNFDDDEEEEDDDVNDVTYGSRASRPTKRLRRTTSAPSGTGHSSLQLTRPQGYPASGYVEGDGINTNITTGGGAPFSPHKNRGRHGMTYSKGGVPLNNPSAGKGNKRRKNYPLSWGAAPDKMRMKKRVLCVYDGPRRLWKDDMMLDADNEVRVMLPGVDGKSWVTDLDIQTLKRAEGLHGATEEEKGPWLDEQGQPLDLQRLMN